MKLQQALETAKPETKETTEKSLQELQKEYDENLKLLQLSSADLLEALSNLIRDVSRIEENQ